MDSQSMKCPMCKSRNILTINEIRKRTFTLKGKEEMTIYPLNQCLNCNAEFNMRMFKDDNIK